MRNNVEWIPTWGAVQNTGLTLSAQRGNAMDIAGLTIALLRASGIPARYVHGTIEVPAERYKNWVGGFTDINAAANYAASGGIPVGTVETAGQISHIQLEHVWVEAAIDYFPSRGAINQAADAWVSMDPSYKQYEFLEGLDPIAISGIDPEQLANDFVATGTVNEAEGWVSGFDPTGLEAAQTQAQAALEDYIANNLTDPTVGDVIGGRKTIIQDFPILPSGLPNPVVAEGARYGKLPANLQQQVSYQLLQDGTFSLDPPLTLPWSRVNNEKLTLSFRPATLADEDALQALLPEGEIADISQLPGSIPAYLIEVIPELKLNGNVIQAGQSMSLGHELTLSTKISYPGRAKYDAHRYSLPAGSYVSVQAIGQSMSPEKMRALQARVEQTQLVFESAEPAQLVNLTREELQGDVFYAGTLSYYAQLMALSHIAGLKLGVHQSVSAGYGTLGYEPKVNYFFGLPTAIEPGAVTLDIPWSQVSHTTDGNWEKRKLFNAKIGLLSSALEHAVPEQMFRSQDLNEPQPDAISTAKALQKATAGGQRIYKITQNNRDLALASFNHDSATISEILRAVDSGLVVVTHADGVSVPGWSGFGYIILDSETGVGAYKISGGSNGSHYDHCKSGTEKKLYESIGCSVYTPVYECTNAEDASCAALYGVGATVVGSTMGKIGAALGVGAVLVEAIATFESVAWSDMDPLAKNVITAIIFVAAIIAIVGVFAHPFLSLFISLLILFMVMAFRGVFG